MVGKLMKHEFIRTRWPLALAGLISLLVVMAGLALVQVSPNIAALPFGLGLLASGAFPFAVQIYLAVDLYRSSFGRRGYFTHSLPVKGSTLLLTKLAFTLIVSLLALGWAAFLLVLSSQTEKALGTDLLGGAWGAIKMMQEAEPGIFWTVAILMIVNFLIAMVQYVFAVVIGSESWINKSGGLGPIVTYVILYVAMQAVALLGLVIPPMYSFEDKVWDWTPPIMYIQNNPDGQAFPMATVLLMIPVAIVLVWRAVVSVSKKLELR